MLQHRPSFVLGAQVRPWWFEAALLCVVPAGVRVPLTVVGPAEEVRSWRIHLRTATELQDLAAWINPIVRGWMTYHGRYYRTALDRLLKRINTYLVRRAQRKYKRLRPFRKALRWWARLTERQPRMFAHWAWMPDLSPGYG
jgi:hypothetical protein